MPEGRLEKAGLEEWIDEMRVTVLSKDTLMREGLLSMLAHQTAFRVAGGTDSVASLPQTVRETQSDLVVVDAATQREVPVSLGVTAQGMVAITGDGVAEGTQVRLFDVAVQTPASPGPGAEPSPPR